VNSRAGKLPIVVLTGREDDEMALRAVREGAQDYLVKGRVETDLLGRSILYAIERKRSQEALRTSEERYALAARGANDGLWDWNLETDQIYLSPRWLEMLGYGPEELSGDPEEWFRRVHEDDVERLRRAIQAHLDGRTETFEFEHRMHHRNGTSRWMLSRGVAVHDESGIPYRMAGSLTDIQDRKLAEERLLHDAFHDPLTELPNWALFMDRLAVAIAHAQRRKDYLFAVLFLDLDRFKNVNDSLGHAVGDQLLVALTRRLEKILRPGDTLARMGGDEFAILADDVGDAANARRVARRIQEELQTPFRVGGSEVFTTSSIGIALSTTGYRRPEDLETDLRRAVGRGEIRTYYQPIISLSTGELAGFEALARWQHPERGLVCPEDFIPLAEDTGLIIPVGGAVLSEACGQTAVWERQYSSRSLSISVNLSGRQFRQPDLVEQIEQILQTTGLSPNRLRLEITESMIMENEEAAVEKLVRLADLNLELYIDDFGTGYSSLSYLHRLPTHAIKIDRSFVSRMSDQDGKAKIVGAIVTLARNLGMTVGAEGLETEDQLSHLRQMECEFGQGYYISPPLDAAAASAFIESKPRW
jgi:diguanylate cyclase (GGDEF)-like protein/PAS domain S-box-containing protein